MEEKKKSLVLLFFNCIFSVFAIEGVVLPSKIGIILKDAVNEFFYIFYIV